MVSKYVGRIAENENYRIEYSIPREPNPQLRGRMLVGLGEIGSGLDDPGFGEKLAQGLGLAYVAIKQQKRTQFQFLSREVVTQALQAFSEDYDLYFYGTSLGGYCAAYFSRPLGANFLALSPRLPTHPITDKRIPIRFKTPGYKHDEIYSGDIPNGGARRIVMLDRSNSVDEFYLATDLMLAYEDLEVHHVERAGHYVPRALQLSGMLKQVVVDFLNDRPLDVRIDGDAVLLWHEEKFHSCIERGRFGHASEHLEVLIKHGSREAIAGYVRALNAGIRAHSVSKAT